MYREVWRLMRERALNENEVDNYKKERDAPRSLLLDAVLAGQARQSGSRLLSLPAEILVDIVDFLRFEKSALASLAQVNSDCLHLARCRQFAEVQFDYSLQSQELITQLANEVKAINTSLRRPFAIGAYVRKLTIAPKALNVRTYHHELSESIFGEKEKRAKYSAEARQALNHAANEHYLKLRSLILTAILSSMPNLETLVSKDRITWGTPEFFQVLSRSSVRYISLDKGYIEDPWALEPPLTPRLWPIVSLKIDLARNPGYEGERTVNGLDLMSTFFRTLLQRCAPTLKALDWGYTSTTPLTSVISFGEHTISLPRLQLLQLSRNVDLDLSAFSTLLVPTLRHLELPTAYIEKYSSCFRSGEPLRDLESLVIPYLPYELEPCEALASFIRTNHHIRKLWVGQMDNISAEHLRLSQCIIPTLADCNFPHLYSLSLVWGGGSNDDTTFPHHVHIPETSLQVIGKLASLRQLRLSAGLEYWSQNQWLVDHDALRRHLKNLAKLQTLAIFRDTYPFPDGFDQLNVELYYDAKCLGVQDRYEAEELVNCNEADPLAQPENTNTGEFKRIYTDEELWEKLHQNRMLLQAQKYADVLPSLEWILCGQRPMAIQRNTINTGTSHEIVSLTEERATCREFLRRKFGIPNDI